MAIDTEEYSLTQPFILQQVMSKKNGCLEFISILNECSLASIDFYEECLYRTVP